MELRHLRYFSAVARTLHFGQAAATLHVAQPALSQAIRQLEAELGTQLFARTTRQVSLTPAGEFLQGEAERILESVEAARRGVARIAEGQKGMVRVGFTGSAATALLPRVARTLGAALPDVALEVHPDLLTGEQATRLAAGTLDLAFLRPPVAVADLTVQTLAQEPLVLALPTDHPLADTGQDGAAAAEPVSLGDLRDERFVAFSTPDSVVNQAALRACREAGFTPRAAHRAPTMNVLLPYVAAGFGVALVPASVRSAHVEGVVLRELAESAPVALAAAWRSDEQSPTVHLVLSALRDAGILPAAPDGGFPDSDLPAAEFSRTEAPTTVSEVTA